MPARDRQPRRFQQRLAEPEAAADQVRDRHAFDRDVAAMLVRPELDIGIALERDERLELEQRDLPTFLRSVGVEALLAPDHVAVALDAFPLDQPELRHRAHGQERTRRDVEMAHDAGPAENDLGGRLNLGSVQHCLFSLFVGSRHLHLLVRGLGRCERGHGGDEGADDQIDRDRPGGAAERRHQRRRDHRGEAAAQRGADLEAQGGATVTKPRGEQFGIPGRADAEHHHLAEADGGDDGQDYDRGLARVEQPE